MNLTPQFRLAMQKHLHLVETLGEEHPDTMTAMMLAMEYAPQALKDDMHAEAVKLDLMPQADGYLENGEPVYRLEDVAAKLGVSVQDARATMDKLMVDRSAAGLDTILIDSALVHRRH